MTIRSNPEAALADNSEPRAPGHDPAKAATAIPPTAYDHELKVACDGAIAAGEILQRYFRDGGYQIDSKGKNNPVTTADFEADSKLKQILRDAFPAYGWLSEETVDNDDRLARERVWIVDPLDGTKEFIKGIPEFVVAIALAERGVPVMGVTYNPIKDELFCGVRGAGCSLDGKAVTVSHTRTIDHSTILASRSETARGEWKAYEGRVIVKAIGSVAYKLALVAAGRADATFTLTPKSEWDIASGVALIVAAGGRVTDLHGEEVTFNRRDVKVAGFVASNGYLHAALERMLPSRDRK
jgi:myo-inositol-1(or 4)-monophosphatase